MTELEVNDHKAGMFDAIRDLVVALTDLAKLATLAVTAQLAADADKQRHAR
jgi:hypothetical protein